MDRNNITFDFRDDERQILYKVNLNVMAINRDEQKALIRFDFCGYDLTKRRNVLLNHIRKEKPDYKQLFRVTNQHDDFAQILETESDILERITEKVTDAGFNIHPMFIEIYVSPLITQLRDEYKLKKAVCAPL